jgi:hypothetical protein
MAALYRIADEPVPGRLAGLTVNPFWPMLAAMLAGGWLALPWFVLNGVAMGSATRRREIAWAAASLAGAVVLAFGLVALGGSGAVPRGALKYGAVLVIAWRLLTAYVIYSLQAVSFELHTHFGGPSRNGALVALAGMFVPWGRVLGDAAGLFHLVLG